MRKRDMPGELAGGENATNLTVAMLESKTRVLRSRMQLRESGRDGAVNEPSTVRYSMRRHPPPKQRSPLPLPHPRLPSKLLLVVGAVAVGCVNLQENVALEDAGRG